MNKKDNKPVDFSGGIRFDYGDRIASPIEKATDMMNYWWERYEYIVNNKERYDKEFFENSTKTSLQRIHYWMKKAGYFDNPETMPTGMECLVLHGINNGTWKAKDKKEVSV